METTDKNKQVTLDTFIGHKNIIETLKISVAAAKKRNEPLGHIFLMGAYGSGKKAMAFAIANTMGQNITLASAKDFKKVGDLCEKLTSLNDSDILVIENFDALSKECLELLYSGLETFIWKVKIGKGAYAREFELPLPRFTLIAITETREKLSQEIEDCFDLYFCLRAYKEQELVELAKNWCKLNDVEIENDAAEKLALFANGSNRRLTFALKRARVFATVMNDDVINSEVVDKVIVGLADDDIS